MQLKFSFSLFGRRFMFRFTVVKEPKVYTLGIASRCADGKHVIFLDYDGAKYEVVIEDIKALQEYYRLGNFYVFVTDKKGRKWHAICLDKFWLKEAYEIISSSSCDEAFKTAPRLFEYRNWVLRTYPKGRKPKPQFVTVVESPYEGLRQQSTAHALYLRIHYGISIQLKNPDMLTRLPFVKYKTAKV